MRAIGLLGVPTNSSGRIDGVARGPRVLREHDLVDAIRGHADVRDYGDVALPSASSERDAETHIIHPQGLGEMVARVRDTVALILDDGNLPLVIGGDCPLLLGCLAAADRRDRLGLLFVDGHEDAYLPEQSSTGEAADMELALALGIADASWSSELTHLLPLVEPANVRILGARDADILRAEGVPSLGDSIELSDAIRLAADPEGIAESACASLPDPWWFYLDLDVLSTDALPAVDYPQRGGLGWEELATVATTALMAQPRGWDVTIYNREYNELLDPKKRQAGLPASQRWALEKVLRDPDLPDKPEYNAADQALGVGRNQLVRRRLAGVRREYESGDLGLAQSADAIVGVVQEFALRPEELVAEPPLPLTVDDLGVVVFQVVLAGG